jgi:glycerate-2-kinase
LQAVQETRKLLSGLHPEDVVVCLISGGASALWPFPVDGVSLEEKQRITSLLMRSGATIYELNAVRKHLSQIKGGQLARWAAPAKVITLIMSDVIGDPLDFIGSGPTAPDTTTFADALAAIHKHDVAAPPSIINRLQAGERGEIAETPKPGDPVFSNVTNLIIANNRLLIDAASAKASELRFNVNVLGTDIQGEAREVALMFADLARGIAGAGDPIQPPACILAAGETTVTVRGDGVGGRNQEMALSWANSIAATPISSEACFASVATDGTDGPTDAAGGLVDVQTCSRGEKVGLDASRFLEANNSLNFLKATGDLITTGPTQTNLMDLQILLVEKRGQ